MASMFQVFDSKSPFKFLSLCGNRSVWELACPENAKVELWPFCSKKQEILIQKTVLQCH